MIAADESKELEFASTIIKQIEVLRKELNTTTLVPPKTVSSDVQPEWESALPLRLQLARPINIG